MISRFFPLAVLGGMMLGVGFPFPLQAEESSVSSPAAVHSKLEPKLFLAQPIKIADPKSVFATVESVDVVPARARIGGTVAELAVDEGDHVNRGEVIAVVGDEKLALSLQALDAQIRVLESELAQRQLDLKRDQDLFAQSAIAKSRLEKTQTAADIAANQLKSQKAERSVVAQQLTEGEVLAPVSGRILKVPVTVGTVIMPGETVANVATERYVLRLRLPERHARHLQVGDVVRLAETDLPTKNEVKIAPEGTIRQIYPEIDDGRVVADVEVGNIGDYFVGERVRVWVSTTERETFVVPAACLSTRFGVDYVRIAAPDGTVNDVVVQRGNSLPQPTLPDGVEILSGLKAGDRLVMP